MVRWYHMISFAKRKAVEVKKKYVTKIVAIPAKMTKKTN